MTLTFINDQRASVFSHCASEGGSYRTIQRFFNTLTSVYWVFFAYILAGDETIVSKSGQSTYGLSRFFSSGHGKTIPGLAFLGLSLVSVKERRSYPMLMEQIVRSDTRSPSPPASESPEETQQPVPRRKRGRPKGSQNRNKTQVQLRYIETNSNDGEGIARTYWRFDTATLPCA